MDMDIIDFNIDKVIKELNETIHLIVTTRKNQVVKRNINTSVKENTDNIHNSNAIYDHDFAQNPVDVISDELTCVEAASSDDVKSRKFDVEIITDNQLNHVCEENNSDSNNFVFNSLLNSNYEKSIVNSKIDCNRSDIYDFNFAQNQDGDFSNKGSFKRYVTPERGGRVANFVTNRYGN